MCKEKLFGQGKLSLKLFMLYLLPKHGINTFASILNHTDKQLKLVQKVLSISPGFQLGSSGLQSVILSIELYMIRHSIKYCKRRCRSCKHTN